MSELTRKSWHPTVTSQFRICPIPFHFDTYRGCHYGCLFCFARDFIQFQRRNRDGREARQSFIEGNSPEGLARWIESVNKSEYRYDKPEQVAFKERIPVKIGATADPFPLLESKERITYDCLKIFGQYDYPVQISTKNPEVFLEYAHEFVGSNIALNVSCSFCDDDIAKKIEKNAIVPSRRFRAIKELSEMGFLITVRLQPFILPYSIDAAERFIHVLKDCGAYAFQTEGMKIRIAMPIEERMMYQKIGEAIGIDDIVGDFKRFGSIEGGDMVYSDDDKIAMLELYQKLSKEHGIRFYNADNLIDVRFGCGSQCCGTDVLRNYKIWGGCYRSRVFGDKDNCSEEFGKCFANFTRSTKNHNKTIAELCDEYSDLQNKAKKRKEYLASHRQLKFDFFDD